MLQQLGPGRKENRKENRLVRLRASLACEQQRWALGFLISCYQIFAFGKDAPTLQHSSI